MDVEKEKMDNPDDLASLTKSMVQPKRKEPEKKPPQTSRRGEPEGVTYFSTKKRLRIRIRPPIKELINRQEYRTPGLSVQFENNSFHTHDQEVIEALNGRLEEEAKRGRGNRMFWKKPSARVLEKVSDVAVKAEAYKKKLMEETIETDDAQELSRFEKMMEVQKKRQRMFKTGVRA